MMENDGRGQAFPFITWKSPDGMMGTVPHMGLSKREYFAAHAPEYSGGHWPFGEPRPSYPDSGGAEVWREFYHQEALWRLRRDVAWRYAYADAMVAAAAEYKGEK